MALYIGTKKVKINFGATTTNDVKNTVFKVFMGEPMFVGLHLKTSDEKILKDSKGLYLTVKKEAN